MIKIISLICFLLFQVIQSKLAQVVSFTRHGSRYVLNNLYDGQDTRYIWGELTATGQRQHQNLGQILRKQYIEKLGFLSLNYNRHQIQVYSTAINRTVQSIISQLYGVYPAGTGPRLTQVDKQYYIPPFTNKTDDPQHNYALPYAYQVIPVKFDQRIMMDQCTGQTRQMNKNVEQQLDEYRQMNVTYWPFIKRMATLFNITGNITLSTISALNSGLQCHLYLGRPMPEGLTGQDRKNMQHIDSWYKQLTFVKDLAKAINRDRFVKIINMFDGRIKNPNQPLKWTFLSGHDLDMVPMYNDLNLSSSKCIEELYRKGQTSALNCEQFPQFASSLIFELYTDGLNHTVKIRSNGKYMNLCNQKSTECRYEDWKKAVQANLASDTLVQSICGKKTSIFEPKIEQQQKSFAQLFKAAYKVIQH